jgi:glycosyltransferase involved in cell wall biosynthesis
MQEINQGRRIKVLHIITGLSLGGAEMTLLRLLGHIDKSTFDSKVISLISIGSVGEKIERLGIPVLTLGMRRDRPNPIYLWKLYKIIKCEKPDLIQTWMYHADLLGGITAAINKIPVIWNIRHTLLDIAGNKLSTRFVAKVCAHLSYRVPSEIVCCARAAIEEHQRYGYDESKLLLIPNGFDLEVLRPADNKELLKERLNLDSETLLVGMVGRFYPQKDHKNLTAAAEIVLREISNVKFVLCGQGIDWHNEVLAGYIREHGLEKDFILLGPREDIQEIISGLDVLTSSSYSEGFPNVVAEAMAAGVPCAVTDVGESAQIVGDTGRSVPPQDPNALGKAIINILLLSEEEKKDISRRARQRIEENYSLTAITKRYENLYKEVLSRCAV